jgi:anaerobic selenocysteine-containing dehydrogenase
MNDSYANDKTTHKVSRDATVIFHPDDANRFGVKEGARVRLENEAGWIELTLKIDDIVQKGVALSYKGRRPKQERMCRNLNTVNPGLKSDMGESSSVHSIEVSIRPC